MKINTVIYILIAFLFCSCDRSHIEYKLEPVKDRDTAYFSKILRNALNRDLKTHLGDDILPDARTAVMVAELYMFKVYGKENIMGERPYYISKYKNYWMVSGSLPEGALGGVFSVILDARDGQVITYWHEK